MKGLTDGEFRRRMFGAAAIMVGVPPLLGGPLMRLAGYYPMPGAWRALFGYTGLYVLVCGALVLWTVHVLSRRLQSLARLPADAAAMRLRRVLRPMPLYLLAVLSAYVIAGVLTVDASLVRLGLHAPWTLRQHAAHVTGAAIPVLATALPLFFHLNATMDRYFAPRRIITVATSLHVKLLVSCLVVPLFVDIMLLAYFSNREGAVDPVALCIWVAMLGSSLAGFLFGRADLNRVLSPLQGLGAGQGALARTAAPLQPQSLDELGFVTSRLLDRIAAEELLRKDLDSLNERLTQAALATGSGVFDHDLRCDALYWTAEVFRIFGMPQVAPVHVSMYVDAVHPDDRQRAEAAHVRSRDPAGNGRFDIEHRIVRPDGSVRWISIHAQTFFSGAGEGRRPVRVVGALVDITARVAMEERRRALEAELQEARRLEAVGTFASGIAHDFNNILAVVSGNLDGARQALPPGHAAAASLGLIELAVRRGADLTGQLSQFARGQRQVSLPTPLAPVVQEAVQLLRSTAPANAVIAVQIHDRHLQVSSAPGQLQQVVCNLVANAVQALGTRGGMVSVDVRGVRLPDAAVTAPEACRPGTWALIEVKDSGCGMTEQTRSRIFQPFFTTRPAGIGTGLGLAVVDGIVRSLGGAIGVHSTPGLGSTFAVWLPLQRAHPATAAACPAGVAS